MQISIRPFEYRDIPDKVRWINDPRNNAYLHYELPLEEEKTRRWFLANCGRTDRYDAVIEADGVPVGLIGLLGIAGGKAEYYITLGEAAYCGKGVAARASVLLLQYAAQVLGLHTIEAYTEVENRSAQRLFDRLEFCNRGIAYASAVNRGKKVDRFYYTRTL